MDDKLNPNYEEVPIPPPYPSPSSTLTRTTEHSFHSISSKEQSSTEPTLPLGHYRSSLLLRFLQWRIYLRAITLLITVTSLVLILIGLVTYEKSKASDFQDLVDPYTGKVIAVEIETKPSVTFAALGGVNSLFGAVIWALCWKSSKINHANNMSNAIICLIGFAGFASTMSACIYMQQNTELRSTLWEWACDNRSNGDASFHYPEICRVIAVSWVLGLLQAIFDILTVALTAVAFSLFKWRLFSRHGRVGRIF